MDIMTIDKLGRLVLPKSIRTHMRLPPGTQLMAVQLGDRLVLERIDAASVARRMHEELKGVDIDRIVREVKQEIEGVAQREIDAILAGHKRVRRRRKARTPGNAGA